MLNLNYTKDFSKKPELILHIGTPKTGSQSLQWALANNRRLLHEESIFYPLSEEWFHYGRDMFGIINEEIIETIIGDDNSLKAKLKRKTEKSVKGMLYKLKKNDYKKITISDVMFFYFYAPSIWSKVGNLELTQLQFKKLQSEFYIKRALRIKQLFAEFNVKIVCYLRRQDLFIESLYNQRCKSGAIKKLVSICDMYAGFNDLSDYVFPFNNNELFFHSFYRGMFENTKYYDILSVWAEVFGKENIIVRPFEKVQLKSGVVRDFFINILNIDSDNLINLKEQHMNERISRDVVEYANRLNKRPKECSNEYMTELSRKLGDVGRYQEYLKTDERIKLLNYHDEGNQKIAREYLNREDGVLFYEEVNMNEPEPYSGLTPEKIALLDKEFALIRPRTISYKIKKIFKMLKHQVECEMAVESKIFLITTLKMYFIIVLRFVKRILRKYLNPT